MEKDHVTTVVADVINSAADAKSWSLAQLTRHLGKGENTLHRWKTGATTAYDLSTIVKLFKMAGMSMDTAFGIPTNEETLPASNLERLAKLDSEVKGIKLQLSALEPVLNLVALVSDAAAGAKTYSPVREPIKRTRRAGIAQTLPLKNLQEGAVTMDPADNNEEAVAEDKEDQKRA